MRDFTDEEVISRVESHAAGFHGWDDGWYDVFIRSQADRFNLFDDKAFLYKVTNGVPKFVLSHGPVTTNAGGYYLTGHFMNPKGCAVLKSDQIVYKSHKYGLHRGKPAYVQQKGFPYYRDNDKDKRAEEQGPVYNDVIAANVHRAGFNSTLINSWSAGCLVTANLLKFQAFMLYMRQQGNPQLTVAILKEW